MERSLEHESADTKTHSYTMALMNKDNTVQIPSKKRKRIGQDEEADAQSNILLLEEQIIDSQKNYNHIVTLLDQARNGGIPLASTSSPLALVALCRVFCKLVVLGRLIEPRQASKNKSTIAQWLYDRLSDYKELLMNYLSDPDIGSQVTALTLLMKLFKEEAEHLQLSVDSLWLRGTLSRILHAVVHSRVSGTTRREFVVKYVEPFDDLRYHTCKFLGSVDSRRIIAFANRS